MIPSNSDHKPGKTKTSSDQKSLPEIFKDHVLTIFLNGYAVLFSIFLLLAIVIAWFAEAAAGSLFAQLCILFGINLSLAIPNTTWLLSRETAARLSMAIGKGSATGRQLCRHLGISPLRCWFLCIVLRILGLLETTVEEGQRRYSLTVYGLADLPRLEDHMKHLASERAEKKKATEDARRAAQERRREAREVGFTEGVQ